MIPVGRPQFPVLRLPTMLIGGLHTSLRQPSLPIPTRRLLLLGQMALATGTPLPLLRLPWVVSAVLLSTTPRMVLAVQQPRTVRLRTPPRSTRRRARAVLVSQGSF